MEYPSKRVVQGKTGKIVKLSTTNVYSNQHPTASIKNIRLLGGRYDSQKLEISIISSFWRSLFQLDRPKKLWKTTSTELADSHTLRLDITDQTNLTESDKCTLKMACDCTMSTAETKRTSRM